MESWIFRGETGLVGLGQEEIQSSEFRVLKQHRPPGLLPRVIFLSSGLGLGRARADFRF
jgi:hypothetical protein